MKTTRYFTDSVMVRRPYLREEWVEASSCKTTGEITMKFQYYSETDMLYIKLSMGMSMESEEVAPGIVLDFDASNKVIGIEIEDASRWRN